MTISKCLNNKKSLYHFVKVTDKTLIGNSTWYFVAKDESQLKEHWEKYAGSEIKEGIRELVGKLDGSFNSHWTTSFASITATLSELSNLPYFIKAVQLENQLYQDRLRYFNENSEVWLSHGLTVFGYCPDFHVILEEVDSDTLVFPDEKLPSMDDVRYIMWNGGKHWYAKIGKIDIVDSNGNQKWNTKEEAESAAREYINSLK